MDPVLLPLIREFYVASTVTTLSVDPIRGEVREPVSISGGRKTGLSGNQHDVKTVNNVF